MSFEIGTGGGEVGWLGGNGGWDGVTTTTRFQLPFPGDTQKEETVVGLFHKNYKDST